MVERDCVWKLCVCEKENWNGPVTPLERQNEDAVLLLCVPVVFVYEDICVRVHVEVRDPCQASSSIDLHLISKLHLIISICICVGAHMCYAVCWEVRGQFTGANSLPPICSSWRFNSCHLSWWQMPLPAEASHQPSALISRLASQ